MRSNKPVSCHVCVDSLFSLMRILQCQDVINFEGFFGRVFVVPVLSLGLCCDHAGCDMSTYL